MHLQKRLKKSSPLVNLEISAEAEQMITGYLFWLEETHTRSRPSILPSSRKQIKKTDKFSSYFSTLSESNTQKKKALLHKMETVDTGFRGVF
jgi:hypothetical protein